MKLLLPSLLLALLALVSACSTTRQSPREAFLARCGDRASYDQIYEVSPEGLEDAESHLYNTLRSQLNALRRVVTNSPPCPALNDFVSHAEHNNEVLHKSRLASIDQLRRSYDPRTDCVLFFSYRRGTEDKTGYLVIDASGAVKRRITFGEQSKGQE